MRPGSHLGTACKGPAGYRTGGALA